MNGKGKIKYTPLHWACYNGLYYEGAFVSASTHTIRCVTRHVWFAAVRCSVALDRFWRRRELCRREGRGPCWKRKRCHEFVAHSSDASNRIESNQKRRCIGPCSAVKYVRWHPTQSSFVFLENDRLHLAVELRCVIAVVECDVRCKMNNSLYFPYFDWPDFCVVGERQQWTNSVACNDFFSTCRQQAGVCCSSVRFSWQAVWMTNALLLCYCTKQPCRFAIWLRIVVSLLFLRFYGANLTILDGAGQLAGKKTSTSRKTTDKFETAVNCRWFWTRLRMFGRFVQRTWAPIESWPSCSFNGATSISLASSTPAAPTRLVLPVCRLNDV